MKFLLICLASATAAFGQQEGAAVDIPNSLIQETLSKTAKAVVSDTALKIVGVNNEYNVEVAIVHRANTHGRATSGAIDHNDLTEVYHVISGNGTMVTEGKMTHAQQLDPQGQTVKLLAGPGKSGDGIEGGTSRKMGPGDVIIIPPNIGHWFSEITSDEIVYMVVRIDPHKVLPAGYGITKK